MDNIYDFDSKFSQTYIETCRKCNKTYEISAQKDDCPEYHTEIFVKCECGAYVNFSLPVN